MADVNKVTVISGKQEKPRFGSSTCYFGTIGTDDAGEVYIWVGGAHGAINLKTGQSHLAKTDLGRIASLPKGTKIELIVNQEGLD